MIPLELRVFLLGDDDIPVLLSRALPHCSGAYLVYFAMSMLDIGINERIQGMRRTP
jgi:hypothetical protein